MSILPGNRVGPYEILSAIGAGGMGEVYRAHDARLNRDVALKVLPEVFAADPDRMARFEREARVLAALNHPNIAAIYGLEEFGSGRALVMELVAGETLTDRIARGPIPLDEALPIAKQMAEALEYAHDRGVIHRDLKPANVKVSADGTVKVLDFGLAKALMDEPVAADPRDSPTLSMAPTMTGVILGTAAYMSPEQAKGKPVDRRADIWAFGVVLFEMLTGKPLYSGETAAETLAAVIKEEPPFDRLPPQTPPAIRNLLRRCLEKNLKRRLQHIGEARIVIEDALSGTAPTERPVVQRRWIIAWVALTAMLLLALVVALSFMRLRELPAQERSVRFQVSPPEKSALGIFRLSPDAHYMVTVTTEGSRTALWLQPLDSLQAQALPGTEDASYPFWSPDSAFIGFFAQGKLKKIAVAGGPPQTLCDAPNGRGGTWNASGVIVFTPDVTGGIYRVSAAGGLAAPVTRPTPSNGGASDRFPEFLPDGNRFLYLQLDDKLENPEISVGSLDGNPPVRILSDNSNAVYVPAAAAGRSGYLLFRRDTTLMAQPFDPDRLQLTSEMFPVAEEVGTRGNQGNAAFSASDNGALAYSTGGNLGISREMAWVDRNGKRLGPAGQPGPISNPALSPDEKRISFGAAQKEGNRFDLWLLDVARGVPSRFTFRSDGADDGIWSPDGSRIVFQSNNNSIYQKPANGSGKEELLFTGGTNTRPSDWSPDGKFVVYESFGGSTGTDVWLLPMEGDHKPLLYLQTPFNEGSAQFSPDGRWMAYASNESGQPQVYVQAIPASGAKWQISPAGGDQPRWRRDGKELFYISADQKLMAVPVKRGATFEASAPQSLFALDPVYPPITGRFAYQPGADGNRFLILANVGGTGAPITVVLNWQAGLKK